MATFSKATRKTLYMQCGGICPECGRKMQNKYKNQIETYMTIDHIVPKSKNGTNNIENLRPLCRSCNMTRGNDNLTSMMAFKDVNGKYIVITC